MEEYMATIMGWAPNFAPRNWAFCAGQTLSISSNTALFSLIGTTYGGNGQTTFNLPDLRGRVPVGAGQGPGTSDYRLGQMGGSETVTLTVAQLAPHTHEAATSGLSATIQASDQAATESVPGTNGATTLGAAMNGGRPSQAYNSATPNVTLNTGGQVSGNVTINPTGSGQPIGLMQPYLAINFIICIAGVFPPRN